jgi:hypothetical protein
MKSGFDTAAVTVSVVRVADLLLSLRLLLPSGRCGAQG